MNDYNCDNVCELTSNNNCYYRFKIKCGQTICQNCCQHECICKIEVRNSSVCQNLSGTLSLNDHVNSLMIWQNNTSIRHIIATIAVFNNIISEGPIQVIVHQWGGNPIEFFVPSGNTLTTTVDHIKSIFVMRTDNGRIEGNFCIDLCFSAKEF